MNTNNNVYTIIYTTVVCVLVAAILAFVSQSLKSRQEANEKAETVSQILTAAKIVSDKSECDAMGNDKVLATYVQYISESFIINKQGAKVADLDKANSQIFTVPQLKAQNYNIKDASKDAELPVYVFNKDGKEVTVIPVYGAGLWGPVWGYIAFESDLQTIVGAYFDHESETPGLGGKIKDDGPAFRDKFAGKKAHFNAEPVFKILKAASYKGEENSIDAISGATMTSNGVNEAINTWFEAYKPYFTK